MRIIAGEYKGKIIKVLKGMHTRPTMDRVRESVFNILVQRVQQSLVLDLYAGSGAFGLEALSRGAAGVVFVENDRKVLDVLRQNCSGIEDDTGKIVVIGKDVFQSIAQFEKTASEFDIIFADPPYFKEQRVHDEQEYIVRILLKKLGAHSILKNNGIIVVEHSAKISLPEREGNVHLYDRRKFGDTCMSFYESICEK